MLASQAEIHALQSQINPHFLYNTLDTIRSMAIIRDSEDIAQMAESLSMLFRYSISRPGEMATLKDELDNVKNYLLIQGYRFPGKFKYQQRIEDEELLQYKLPVLTIQPVIENAIHHGLETKVGGGQVSVYAYGTQERFIIRIADNGMGMTEQQMDSLRERLAKGRFVYEQDRDLKKRGNTGIALPNVNQRIKFYYGDDYGIKVYSTAGIGTIVEIILPAAADAKGGES
jgi:two-component system sensor histidine kinase YesM